MSDLAVFAKEPADGLFPALCAGIAEFRGRVEGTRGNHRARILGIKDKDGVVRNVVRTVLEAMLSVLEWLRDAIRDLGVWIAQTDALLAVVEIFGLGLQGLGEVLDDPNWPDPMKGPVQDFGGALAGFGGAVAALPERIPPSVVPNPSTLAAIVAECEALVGSAEQPSTGSLKELLTTLGG